MQEDVFNVQDVLEDVCEILGTLASNKDIDLAFLVCHDVPKMVRGDLGKLRQVLLNLIGICFRPCCCLLIFEFR